MSEMKYGLRISETGGFVVLNEILGDYCSPYSPDSYLCKSPDWGNDIFPIKKERFVVIVDTLEEAKARLAASERVFEEHYNNIYEALRALEVAKENRTKAIEAILRGDH